MNRVSVYIICALAFAFAQEGAIKFQLPLDATGAPVVPTAPATQPAPVAPVTQPAPVAPVTQPAPTAPVVAANPPLNLAELSAKDTASFETYSKRMALVQDSITAMRAEIENSKKRSASQMPALGPKGEFEKQAEFDARKAKWEKDLEEKTIREAKPFSDRLAELEKAKKKIEANQTSLYSTIEIKTNPASASISLNREEIGASPVEYKLALPGTTVITVQKENYDTWDTTFTLQPAQKIKINVALQEKSIFSKEGELDFLKILAKDTTVAGYRERIKRVEARDEQIEKEMKAILENFGNSYPALEPQGQYETAQEFEHRKTAWNNEGVKQVSVLKQKYEVYKNKLIRTIEVIKDNIVVTEGMSISETPLSAKITLGAYDVEREVFEVEVQDTASSKTPFYFSGIVGIPRDTAKVMNRSVEGFLTSVSYLNYPFVFGDSSFNLAMKGISISRKAVPLKVDGAFKPIGRFEAMEGYGAWRAHADSLLNGALKAQGLDINYALKADKAKAVEKDGGSGLGWRGWTRILTFTAAAALGTVAIMKQMDASDNTDKITKLGPPPPAALGYDVWSKEYLDYANKRQDSENSRNIFGACASVFAVGGILTFVF